jgi:hypothetical protein
MAQAATLTGGAELVLVDWREGHWLYARQPIVHFGMAGSSVEQAAQWLRDHPKTYALVPDEELEKCFNAQTARELGETSRAQWSIVRADADNGKCHPLPPANVYHFTWNERVNELKAALR